MIHTLSVEPGLTLVELKKQARKFLMTGGAVIRLPSNLGEPAQRVLFDEYRDAAVASGGLALEVLCQLAAYPQLSDGVESALRSIGAARVDRALDRRTNQAGGVSKSS